MPDQQNQVSNLSPPDNYNGPKRSLILAGGGMRLAYQAGVLKAFEEHGLCFHHADGTSGGIMNLAMLLSGQSPAEMCRNWTTLKIKNFVSALPFGNYIHPLKIPAFGDADGIINKVFPHLQININKINAEKHIAGTFNVCNYSNKTNEAISNDQVTLKHLIAGISLPLLMPAVKIGTDWYIDSVWIKDANLLEAVKRGAEEIWLIWAIGNIHEYKSGSFNQYVHMIEMSANGALFAELDYINELNGRIQKGDSPYGQQRTIHVHIIKPEYPLPLDTDLFFNRINTTTLIEMGYADARNYLADINDSSLSPGSTKMKSQGVAFTCRARLSGHISGKKAALHFSLSINDVQQFIELSDPYLLAGSLTLDDAVYYAYNAEIIKRKPGSLKDHCVCSFCFDVDGAPCLLVANLKLKRTFFSAEICSAQTTLSKGGAEGELLSNDMLNASATDRHYFKKSFSWYNYKNRTEKIKHKRTLINCFFDRTD